MSSVHDVPKRREDVGDRYRMTRIAFDVISAFGCLQARGLPGPVIVSILSEHGYSSSSVHNQLVRMVHRGLLTSERVGRVTVYRLGEQVLTGFEAIAGDSTVPVYSGHFHTIIYAIPESARGLRDRLIYLSRHVGYRQLRPGILISCVNRADELLSQLPDIEAPGWCEFGELTPDDQASARRMITKAYCLDEAADQMPALEARMDELSSGGQKPGTGCAQMSLRSFFDLFFEVAQCVFAHPLLPTELVEGTQPAIRFRELMNRCNLEYYLRFDQQILETVSPLSSFDLIEWLPGR